MKLNINLINRVQEVKTKDDKKIIVDVVGNGKKIAILIHGIGGSSHTWIPFALQNRGGYTFVIPNLRGYGKSRYIQYSKPEDVLADYADDIDAIVKHYKTEGKVTIVALSLGAYSTMHYFQKYGTADVEKFLCIDQSPKAMNNKTWKWGLCGPDQEEKFAQFDAAITKSTESLGLTYDELDIKLKAQYLDACGSFFETAFHRSLEKKFIRNVFKGKLGKIARTIATIEEWESYHHCWLSYRNQDYDFRPTMKNLDIPTTLFIGGFSEMYPLEGQMAMAKTNELIKPVVFNEGHALMFTAPVSFSKQFNKFLKGTI
jgi:pimeloyl-ACP methyl ester carboxylesterase